MFCTALYVFCADMCSHYRLSYFVTYLFSSGPDFLPQFAVWASHSLLVAYKVRASVQIFPLISFTEMFILYERHKLSFRLWVHPVRGWCLRFWANFRTCIGLICHVSLHRGMRFCMFFFFLCPQWLESLVVKCVILSHFCNCFGMF